ncbi:MAG: helix-turn-helix domain-containing protein [Candidatus Aenigmarchaeota archaeon]|nr:helix-turn-helix domain-containing protein [Candidatus Aenigmarchaeota archaeon]
MVIIIKSEKEFRDTIVSTIRSHPEGLTIQDLANLLGHHRQTISKYISFLEGAGIIHRRRIGAVTLHYLRVQYEQFAAQGAKRGVRA